MFTLVYSTHEKEYSVSVIDKDYALTMFMSLIKAVDLKTVALTDGFTGEVLWEYTNGEFKVFDGHIVK